MDTVENRTIYILWFQGFDQAPMVVQKCLKSWRRHNQDWSIVTLDEGNISQYIDIKSYVDIENKSIGSAHKSDLIRLQLLQKYGGVWVDATTFCMKPLDDWLDSYEQLGFFMFDKPGPDRPISNWFIYAKRGNYLLNRLYQEMASYWKDRIETDDYFCFHRIFGRLSAEDEKFKERWDRTPKSSADLPHFILKRGLLGPLNKEIQNHIDGRLAPLYKLTYRYRSSLYNDDCVLAYLLNSKRIKLDLKRFLTKLPYNQPKELTMAASTQCSTGETEDNLLKNAFETVYKRDRWGQFGNHSGLGSTLASAQNIMTFIDHLITEFDVRTVVDVSCGGMLWLSRVLKRHPKVKFLGLDASKTVIERNKRTFKEESNWEFKVHDYTVDEPVKCDMIICRHTIMHLMRVPGKKMVNNLFKSARYVLLTSHENVSTNPLDIQRRPLIADVDGGYCWINMDMRKPPFSLPEPELKRDESSNNPAEFLYLYVNRKLQSSLQIDLPPILKEWMAYINNKLVQLIGPTPEGNIYSKHLSKETTDLLVAKQRNMTTFFMKFKPSTILEVGFNTGYSALLIKMILPKSELTCIDINMHNYVIPCYKQISEDFSSVELHTENSHTMLPKLRGKKYDVIHIDGDHSPGGARQDFNDCLLLSHPGTIIIFDDTNQSYLNNLCQSFVNQGKVKEYLFDKIEGIRHNHRFLEVL